MTALALIAALALDAVLGEPRWLWSRVPHPAVLMGRAVGFLDATLNRGAGQRAKGVLAVLLLLAGALALGAAVAALPLAPVCEVLVAAILLAQRSLVEHVRAVGLALDDGLEAGRLAVARIVGRDTDEMDEAAIARAAIESAAENFSDGVVAPALWFLLLGLPGIVAYKAINTADSMIGYLTPRHAAFGWAAARLDDLVNWVPARLSAALIALAFGLRDPGGIRADAGRHRSPNAGWPEAAMARALGVALAGPRRYSGQMRDYDFVNAAGARAIGRAEVLAAAQALWRVWALGVGLLAILAVALA